MTQIALHELQIIDNRISRLDQQLVTLEEKRLLDEKLSELGRLGKIASDQAQTLAAAKERQQSIEEAIAVLTEKISREEARLYGGRITSPKELKGIEDEVKALKDRRDRDETGLLEKIEAIDNLAAEYRLTNEALETARAEADGARFRYEKVGGEIESQRRRLNLQREETLAAVSPDTLKLYDRLRHEKQGLAVAQLDGSTCGGCHMELPAQELERIVAAEQVWRCPHCRRILVRRV